MADDSRFMLTLEGDADSCQGDSTNGLIKSSILMDVLDREPYSDG
jgi:hypothetical protein